MIPTVQLPPAPEAAPEAPQSSPEMGRGREASDSGFRQSMAKALSGRHDKGSEKGAESHAAAETAEAVESRSAPVKPEIQNEVSPSTTEGDSEIPSIPELPENPDINMDLNRPMPDLALLNPQAPNPELLMRGPFTAVEAGLEPAPDLKTLAPAVSQGRLQNPNPNSLENILAGLRAAATPMPQAAPEIPLSAAAGLPGQNPATPGVGAAASPVVANPMAALLASMPSAELNPDWMHFPGKPLSADPAAMLDVAKTLQNPARDLRLANAGPSAAPASSLDAALSPLDLPLNPLGPEGKIPVKIPGFENIPVLPATPPKNGSEPTLSPVPAEAPQEDSRLAVPGLAKPAGGEENPNAADRGLDWDFESRHEGLRPESLRPPLKPEAPALPEPAPRATLPHLPSALLAHMAQSMKGGALAVLGREEIFVQMEPAHLGRVQVAMEMHQGRLAARIGVESENVRQLLDSQLPALRQSLEQQGVRLESVEVSVQDRHASLLNPDGQNAEEFFQRRRAGGGSPDEGGAAGAADGRSEADTGRRWGFNTVEYIA